MTLAAITLVAGFVLGILLGHRSPEPPGSIAGIVVPDPTDPRWDRQSTNWMCPRMGLQFDEVYGCAGHWHYTLGVVAVCELCGLVTVQKVPLVASHGRSSSHAYLRAIREAVTQRLALEAIERTP